MRRIQSEKSFRVSSCKACLSPHLKLWFSLGDQPPANALLDNPNQSEDMFPLDVCICSRCGLVQLRDVVDPKVLFGNYVYFSSTAASFVAHFEEMAEKVFKSRKLKEGDLVVDIGSNDGILLNPFKKLGAEVVGVEPAKHIAKTAELKGVPTVAKFFSRKVAREIIRMTGQNAKVVTATNVFAHIYDLDEVVAGVKELLDDDGVFIIENPYLWEMIKQGTFDLVYHEHLFYYDLTGISALLTRLGMKLIDFEVIPVHGGSMRYFASKDLSLPPSLAVRQTLKNEARWRKTTKFKMFARKIKENKIKLVKVLNELKKKNKLVVGYGAPAKASTILNYFGVRTDQIKFIVDDSPAKQGKFLPGVHIPIVQTEDLFKAKPDCVIILAWNFAKPISQRLRQSGYKGKIITPF